MINSKVFSVLLMGMIMLTFVTTLVSATWADSITKAIDGIQQSGDPIFSALLGQTTSGSDLFVKVLAFMLVMFVIYGVLGMVKIFGDKPWLNMVIGTIVAIIGIRFLPEGFLTEAAIPSSAFVAILVMGIPFILLFFMIKDLPKAVRKVVWVCYAVLIFILWTYNWDRGNVIYVYPVMIIASLALLTFDGVIQRFFNMAKREREVQNISSVQINRVKAEIRDLQGALAAATTPADMTKIKKQINAKKLALSNMQV